MPVIDVHVNQMSAVKVGIPHVLSTPSATIIATIGQEKRFPEHKNRNLEQKYCEQNSVML